MIEVAILIAVFIYYVIVGDGKQKD